VSAVSREAVVRRLADLVREATDGQVAADEAAGAASLTLLGVGSLARLRLLDAVEREFGTVVDVEDDPTLDDDLGRLADHLLAAGAAGEAAR